MSIKKDIDDIATNPIVASCFIIIISCFIYLGIDIKNQVDNGEYNPPSFTHVERK